MPNANFIASGDWNCNKYKKTEEMIKKDPFQFNKNSPFRSLLTVLRGIYKTNETYE